MEPVDGILEDSIDCFASRNYGGDCGDYSKEPYKQYLFYFSSAQFRTRTPSPPKFSAMNWAHSYSSTDTQSLFSPGPRPKQFVRQRPLARYGIVKRNYGDQAGKRSSPGTAQRER
jgi:hypothetical protein